MRSVRTSSAYSTAYPLSQVLGIIFQKLLGATARWKLCERAGLLPRIVGLRRCHCARTVGCRGRHPLAPQGGGWDSPSQQLSALAASILQPVDDHSEQASRVGQTWWNRSLIPLAFCLAMLAGIGLDAVIRGPERRRAARWALGAFGVIAVMLGLVWLFGRGNLPAYAAHVRAQSFVWPAVSTAVGLVVFGAAIFVYRRSKSDRWSRRQLRVFMFGMAGSLLVCQTAFLVVDDSSIPSSSPTEYKRDTGVTALETSRWLLVGRPGQAGTRARIESRADPEHNAAFGVDEFAEYDPIAPLTYFTTWYKIEPLKPGGAYVYDFIPGINSATVARRYGIPYVLEAHGDPGPTGGIFVDAGGQRGPLPDPGAAEATLVPAQSATGWPTTDAPGKAVPLPWPGPSEVRVMTNASSAKVLRLRIASFPGWQATIDGRPLALTPYLSMMLQARIPPGSTSSSCATGPSVLGGTRHCRRCRCRLHRSRSRRPTPRARGPHQAGRRGIKRSGLTPGLFRHRPQPRRRRSPRTGD